MTNRTVGYVLDNAGFELFTDLCLADWLTHSALVHKVWCGMALIGAASCLCVAKNVNYPFTHQFSKQSLRP